MEVPQPSDNALQGLVQLLSAITTPKLPSASPAPATLAGRAESNGILDSLSEAFHRALEQDRHETEQDVSDFCRIKTVALHHELLTPCLDPGTYRLSQRYRGCTLPEVITQSFEARSFTP